MNYNRGSEWRKWDLHVHSNASDGKMSPQEIVDKAIEKNISVIALTDHHTAKNIDIIRSLAYAKDLNVIAGIEFRTEYGSKSVHMIGLFPDEFNGTPLDSISLHDLILSPLGLSETAIIAKGREKNASFTPEQAFDAGMHLLQVDFKKAAGLIRKYGGIVTAHAGSKSNSFEEEIKHQGKSKKNVAELYDSLGTLKEELLNDYIDICEINRANDSDVFYLEKFNRPSIIASDAHQIEEVGNKYVWIKANPTFEGLKQILCEPEDRIVIQESHPEEKKSYNVIDRVQFIDLSDSIFQSEPILLNSGLNAIIGGKSSGKSLLLNMMAKEMGAKNSKIEGYKDIINGVSINVYYKDNPSQKRDNTDGRKIEFLPQLYISEIVSNKESQASTDRSFNTFIEELIRQDEGIKGNMDDAKAKISSAIAAIDAEITKWGQLDNQLKLKKEEREKLGDKNSIANEIERISSEINKLKENAGWSEDEKKEYDRLVQENKNNTERLIFLEKEISETKRLEDYLNQQIKSEILDSTSFSSDILEVNNLMERVMISLSSELDKIVASFTAEIASNKDVNAKLLESTHEHIQKNNNSLEPYISKNASQLEIEKQERKKAEEENKIALINEKEKEITDIRAEITNLKFVHHYQIIQNAYYDLATSLNTAISAKWREDETKLQIKASTEFKSAVFINSITGVINNKSYLSNQFNSDGYNIFNINDYIYDKDNHINNLAKLVELATSETDRFINFKNGKNSKEFLASLLKDCFTIEYDVIKNEDSLHKMSEGKKGIVVLQLYLSLSGSDCPILIDQPEDNLDNRTVYQELNNYIKQCKKRRQIIMVSHNANLVVNTDAENVIVANQSGEDNKDNKKYRFEYVNGALESTFRKEDEQGVLYKQGIREHVCEILEGGVDAFKKREEKYHIKG